MIKTTRRTRGRWLSLRWLGLPGWGIVINGAVGHSIEGGTLFSLGIRYGGRPWLIIF